MTTTDPLVAEMNWRMLIYLIIHIIFSLACATVQILSLWANTDPDVPLDRDALDMSNLFLMTLALPLVLTFLMAYDCGCERANQFPKFLFVFFTGLSLSLLIINWMFHQFMPDKDFILEGIFGFKPGNVKVDITPKQIGEISMKLSSPEFIKQTNKKIHEDTAIEATVNKINDDNIELNTTSGIVSGMKVLTPGGDIGTVSSVTNNAISIRGEYNVKDNDILKFTDENSLKSSREKLVEKGRKELETDLLTNVDAIFRKHPFNYTMRNFWFWVVFVVTLFVHSIRTNVRYQASKITSSSTSKLDFPMDF